MWLKALSLVASITAGTSFLTLAAPLLGEVIAILPPIFAQHTGNPLTELGLPYEDVTFPSSEGLLLRGWFIPAGQPTAPAIVYAPATGHDQRSGLSLVPAFHQAGYHVLLFSYRGQGQSEGKWWHFTYGDGESQDVDAAVRFLYERRGIRRIGVIGHSVGAVSAILSAARNPRIGAVVAVAPFTSLEEVWQTNRPALVPPFILNWTLWVAEKSRGFDRDNVCPLNVVGQIAPRPLLLIHGSDDRRITSAQVQRLYDMAQARTTLWSVVGATHGSIRSPLLDELAPDVIAFLDAAWAP